MTQAVGLQPPALGTEYPAGDARDLFAEHTARTPQSADAEAAFVINKMQLLRTHPMAANRRDAELRDLWGRMRNTPVVPTRPVPGGVGYGMFFSAPFKTAFATGTTISWEIVCPTPPGGNVTDFLYLTATNRSALGVEAFVAYHGQNDTSFNVFDWARPESQRWQTHVPFGNLGNYLLIDNRNGIALQVLPLINTTSEVVSGQWTNDVRLWNHVTSQWDIVYQFVYAATGDSQRTGWVGSWGPIVETFQDAYSATADMGALKTSIATRDIAGAWSPWQPLLSSESDIRIDNKGFQQVFLDPNSSWAVSS